MHGIFRFVRSWLWRLYPGDRRSYVERLQQRFAVEGILAYLEHREQELADEPASEPGMPLSLFDQDHQSDTAAGRPLTVSQRQEVPAMSLIITRPFGEGGFTDVVDGWPPGIEVPLCLGDPGVRWRFGTASDISDTSLVLLGAGATSGAPDPWPLFIRGVMNPSLTRPHGDKNQNGFSGEHVRLD